MNLLNVGCGDIFHPDWENIDIQSNSEHVRAHDLRRGIPFDADTFDAVYHSHVFEHLRPNETEFFLKEIKRVLKPGGIMRVVVPDLEKIAQLYLEKLNSAEKGLTSFDYDWMVIELLDQLTREKSGGQMRQFLLDPAITNKEFILSRMGSEAEKIWVSQENPTLSFFEKLKTKNIRFFIQKIRYHVARAFLTVLGNEFKLSFEQGYFRQSGEIHQWMYDRYSLKRLLEQNGFRETRVMTASQSGIAQFDSFYLDVHDSKVRKPDSLFLECRKL